MFGAIYLRRYPQFLRFMVDEDNVNKKNQFGETPLIVAIRCATNGCEEVHKMIDTMLKSETIDINIQSSGASKETALMKAISTNQIELAKKICAKFKNKLQGLKENSRGENVLDLARRKKDETYIDEVRDEYADLIQKLKLVIERNGEVVGGGWST